MTIELTHPEGLLQQDEYSPVATASGTRIVLLAGQAAATPAGEATSGDLAEQVYSALKNVAIGVRGAGGTVDDIARLTMYVVGWDAEMAPALFSGIARAQELEGYPAPMPPLTVIGVQALWTPDFLVEIEATAVLA